MSRRNAATSPLHSEDSLPMSVADKPLPMFAMTPSRKPRRRLTLGRVGLLLCIQYLVLVLANVLWNYVFFHESGRSARGMGEPETRLKGFDFGFEDGGADKGSGQGVGRDTITAFRQDIPTNFNPKAVLLVALADGEEGMIALQAWAGFVSRELRLRQRSDNRGENPEKEGFHSQEASPEEAEAERRTSIPPQQRQEEEEEKEEEEEEEEEDKSSDDFPAVWMLTTDPYLDEAIRSEMMPYVRPFFVVSGAAASAYASSSDDSLAGPSAPAYAAAAISAAAAAAASEAADAAASEAVYSSLWVDVIERFLAENQGVDVFGVFGEGTLPSPGLGRVVDVLRPVMGRSAPPTAVLARSRFLGAGGDADGGREDGGKVKGEWLPDKLLAQVWFNRAMLAAARRKGTGLQDEVVGVGGRGCGDQEGLSMLQVLRRLVRDPSALGALVVDGTTVVGSTHARARGWSPPAEAMAAARAAEARGRGQGKGWSPQIGESYQSDSADLGADYSNNSGGDDGGVDIFVAPLGETSSASEWWVYDHEEEDSERVRGWESFWGGSFLSGFSLDGSQQHQTKEHKPSCDEANAGDAYIGSVEYALVKERGGASQRGEIGSGSESGGGYTIQRAMWPRRYILDEVADPETGLVMVTNVNCGYLDMAVNFLLSVRRHSDVKILFVAMDEVSFEYLDTLTPGCVVLYDNGGSRHRAVGAGIWGDATFKAETVVRPEILLNIMRQGYTILWTDVDMVWLGNPLGWLPNKRKNPSAAEIMLQIDGKPINKCTCFMYLDPTPSVLRLIELWKQEIIDTRVDQNQEAFHSPLIKMEGEGLQLDILPDEVMPPGFKFFNRTFMEENRHRYEGRLLIIHNNWIIGHDPKRQRFKDYNLWDVEDWEFPKCTRKRSLRVTQREDSVYY